MHFYMINSLNYHQLNNWSILLYNQSHLGFRQNLNLICKLIPCEYFVVFTIKNWLDSFSLLLLGIGQWKRSNHGPNRLGEGHCLCRIAFPSFLLSRNQSWENWPHVFSLGQCFDDVWMITLVRLGCCSFALLSILGDRGSSGAMQVNFINQQLN